MEEKPLSIQVYEKIKESIISLEYPPGSMLTERELAQSMGVSRTPVREALQRLSQERWVISGDGKRIQVRPVTLSDVHEIIQIRNIVEYSALDWLVRKGEPRVVAGQLDSILNEMKRAEDQYTFTSLDLSFHSMVVSSMRNDRLMRFWSTVKEEVVRMGLMALRGKDRFNEVIKEHEMFVESLWNKDTKKVQGAMHEHLENSYTSLLASLEISEDDDTQLILLNNDK